MCFRQDGLEEDLHQLGNINSIVQDASTSDVLVLGVYNDFGTRCGQELQDFAAEHMLGICDKVMCNNDFLYTLALYYHLGSGGQLDSLCCPLNWP